MTQNKVDPDYLDKNEYEYPIYPIELKKITDALQSIMARLEIIETRLGL